MQPTWCMHRAILTGCATRSPLQLVVLLVGVNNLLPTKPWEKLDFLLNQYFATAMPTTNLVVVAPLPSYHKTSATLTQQYR